MRLPSVTRDIFFFAVVVKILIFSRFNNLHFDLSRRLPEALEYVGRLICRLLSKFVNLEIVASLTRSCSYGDGLNRVVRN